MNKTVDGTISRRKQKKMAKSLESGKVGKIQAETAAAKRNARSRRLHSLLRSPGCGGLTAKGAAQLQQFFSKKVPQSKKPTLREMDESALTVLMQMAAEEMGVKDLEYEELKKLTEGIMMADRPGGKEKAEEEERKAEGGVETEGLMQVEGKEVEDERDGKGEETVQAEGPMEVEDEEDKAEGIQTEGFMEVEDEDGEQGGVVLAKDW